MEEVLPNETQLLDRFTIKSFIAKGGFGITYKAFDNRLEIDVCIKELYIFSKSKRRPDHSVETLDIGGHSFDYFKRKAFAEARQVARLDHPNIVNVIDVLEANNTVYIVMEYIHGETLQHRIDQDGKLTYEQVNEFSDQIFSALNYMHGNGVLHGDLKPENIMLDRKGRIKLIDFGTSKDSFKVDTRSSLAMLSPGFAPIEQYANKGSSDERSDVYAMAASLYYLLTGSIPKEASERVLKDDVKPPYEVNRKVHPILSEIIIKGLAVKPEDRFSSISEFQQSYREALRKTIIEESPTEKGAPEPRPIENPPATPPPFIRRYGIWAVILLVILIGGYLVLDSSSGGDKEKTKNDVATSESAKDKVNNDNVNESENEVNLEESEPLPSQDEVKDEQQITESEPSSNETTVTTVENPEPSPKYISAGLTRIDPNKNDISWNPELANAADLWIEFSVSMNGFTHKENVTGRTSYRYGTGDARANMKPTNVILYSSDPQYRISNNKLSEELFKCQ